VADTRQPTTSNYNQYEFHAGLITIISCPVKSTIGNGKLNYNGNGLVFAFSIAIQETIVRSVIASNNALSVHH